MTMSEDLTFASADVAVEMQRSLVHIGAERRLSPKTVEAYGATCASSLDF